VQASVLFRPLAQEGQSPDDKFDTTGAQDSEAPTCDRDSLIFDATRSLLEAVLVLQGRVKALELIAVRPSSNCSFAC
jgi:hypothetical protein